MKKTIVLLTFSLLFAADVFAQTTVIDIWHAGAVAQNGAVRSGAEAAHNNYLGNINNNLNTVIANMSTVVLAQTLIYNALSNVNSALKNGLAVKNMAVISRDMINYLDQCMVLAKAQPDLLLFATGIENEMQVRAASLVADVSAYILKEGDNVLADYNSRDQLLRKVTEQLQILDGLAYGAWRAMFWAKQRGVFTSANPYANWINKDKNFASQIISNTKYLKQ